MPTYFKIAGLNSQFFVALIIIILYILLQKEKRLSHTTLRYCAVFFTPYLVSLAVHAEWYLAVRQFLEIIVLLVIVVDTIRTEEDIRKVIHNIVVLSAVESFFAVIHFAFDYNVFSLLSNTSDVNFTKSDFGAGTQYRFGMPRVEGSFSHAITFGVYLSICSLLCIYLYQRTKKKGYIGVYVVNVVALFMTLSRMPIIVFIVSQIIYLFVLDFRRTLKILGVLFFTIVIAAIVINLFFPGLADKISTMSGLFTSVFSSDSLSGIASFNQDSAFSYRAEMVRAILPSVGDHFLFGIGSIDMADFSFLINGSIQRSIDNQYLYFLVLYGICGCAFSILWVCQLLLFRRKKKEGNRCLKLCNYSLYRNLIIFVYLINLFSVAMMEEYKLIVMFVSLSLCEVYTNHDSYRIHRVYRSGVKRVKSVACDSVTMNYNTIGDYDCHA